MDSISPDLDIHMNLKEFESIAYIFSKIINGKEYVMGYTAKDLDEQSRILVICDIYQPLTEKRPYKKAFSNEKAFL